MAHHNALSGRNLLVTPGRGWSKSASGARLPLASLKRAEGARIVRNGSAHVRFAQGIGTATISDSQRRPLALTKCPLEDRTGSR